MVLEKFRDGNARAVYERLAKQGRQIPPGVEFVDSWVDADLSRCFQLMRSSDLESLRQWSAHWEDLVDFEFVPVITSEEARVRARHQVV